MPEPGAGNGRTEGVGTDGWRSSGLYLDERRRRIALDHIEEAGGRAAFSLAAFSGSFMAGLGHGVSDVDVLVVPRPGVETRRLQTVVDNVAVQLNPIDPDRLEFLCDVGSRFRATARDRVHLYLPYLDQKDLVRLTICDMVFVDDHEKALVGGIDRTGVRRLTMCTHGLVVARHAEDGLGAVRSGDALVGIAAARIALTSALEIALAGADDLYVGEKFILRRAGRAGLLSEVVWSLLATAPDFGASPSDVRDYVRRCLFHAGHLAAQAAMFGWEAPLAEARPANLRLDGPVRSPYYVLVRFDDTPALSGPDVGLRVNEDVARLWTCLDGSPVEDVAKRMSRLGSGAGTVEDIQPAIDKLASTGAVELRWDDGSSGDPVTSAS